MATLSSKLGKTNGWVNGVNTQNPEAVKRLQGQLGVTQDGIYGKNTASAHNAMMASQLPEAPAHTTTMDDLNNKFAKSNGGAAGAGVTNDGMDWGGIAEGVATGATALGAVGQLFEEPTTHFRHGSSTSSTASALQTLLSPIGRL
ncbi:hypothetical protein AB4379_12190 [Vibrio breoganii]